MKHELARSLRREQTGFERKLWYELRDRRFLAHKFRRQQPIGPYIADFVSFEARIVIELDGSQHAEPENIARDLARTVFLESQGYRVLRFWNDEVKENLDGTLESIRIAIDEPPLTHG
jgi:adenine-specific DNA-methyltransferase